MPSVPPVDRREFARAPPARVVRQIETEHFIVVARQRAVGRLCHYTVTPVSAAAIEWVRSQGAPVLQARAPLSRFEDVLLELEARLHGYWGPALDTRRRW